MTDANHARTAAIVNAYSSRNAGDAAIMLSTVQVLRDIGYERFFLVTRYTDDLDFYARFGIEVVPCPIEFPTRGGSVGPLKKVLTFGFTALTAFLAVTPAFPNLANRSLGKRGEALTILRSADLRVIAGGGYMYSSKRTFNLSLIHSCMMAYLCAQLGSTLMMPQSIGPFTRRIDRTLVTRALADVDVVVRESKSIIASRYPYLGSFSFCHDVALVPFESADESAFAGAPSASRHKRTVRVAVMDWRWSTSVNARAYSSYLLQLAEITEVLDGQGYSVVLGGHSRIPEHAQDDIEVARQVRSQLPSPSRVTVDENVDVQHLSMAYRAADFVISTRLHGCLMSLAQGTPAISLAYQDKAVGVGEALDQPIPTFWVDTRFVELVLNAVDSLNAKQVRTSASRARAEIMAHYTKAAG